MKLKFLFADRRSEPRLKEVSANRRDAHTTMSSIDLSRSLKEHSSSSSEVPGEGMGLSGWGCHVSIVLEVLLLSTFVQNANDLKS